jgi:hypothetical protein
MAGELDKWAKRHCYPVDLGDNDNGYVKPMRFRDMDSLSKMESNITSTQRTQWYLACCLCDETGQSLVPEKAAEETGEQFLKRIDDIFGEWETPMISKAMAAIMKVISPTDPDTLVKN